MNKLEVSKLLTAISTYDNRKIAQETVEAWYLTLKDLGYEEASQAVVLHFQKSTNWLLPAQIRYNVQIVRDNVQRELRRNRPEIESNLPDFVFDREEHERLVQLLKEEAKEIE